MPYTKAGFAIHTVQCKQCLYWIQQGRPLVQIMHNGQVFSFHKGDCFAKGLQDAKSTS